MSILDKLNRSYVFESTYPKSDILNNLIKHIEEASNSKDKISFNTINYNQFKISDDKITIDRDPIMATPWQGIGTIIITLKSGLNKTVANVLIEPFSKSMLKVTFGIGISFFVLLSTFLLWKAQSLTTIVFLIGCLIFLVVIFFIGLIRTIWSLEFFVEALMKDLKIEGYLQSID